MKSQDDPQSSYNSDKPGITANIYYTAGGADYYYYAYEMSSAPVSSWTYYENPHWGWLSDWIFIGGTFTVTQPILNGELNISIQNWNRTYSAVYVDDAILQRVPEPATLLLLGLGLVGLAGARRMRS